MITWAMDHRYRTKTVFWLLEASATILETIWEQFTTSAQKMTSGKLSEAWKQGRPASQHFLFLTGILLVLRVEFKKIYPISVNKITYVNVNFIMICRHALEGAKLRNCVINYDWKFYEIDGLKLDFFPRQTASDRELQNNWFFYWPIWHFFIRCMHEKQTWK